MRVFLAVVLTAALGLLAGCDSATAPASSVTPDLEPSVAQSNVTGRPTDNPAELNRSLEEFARVLALSLGDVRVREAISQGVNERFDGAPNILFRTIQGRSLGRSTFRASLVAALARGESVSEADAGQRIDRLAAVSQQLQIAVPVLAGQWDPSTYRPLVAAHPYGIAEDQVRQIKAYDANGNLVLLDGQVSPARPVIVVSLNERTDATGSVRSAYLVAAGLSSSGPATANACPVGGCGGGPPPPPPTGSFRSGAYPERLQRIAIYDDHELWTIEPAEINTMVMCPGQSTPVFKSLLGDPEPEALLLYAGLDQSSRYAFRQNSSDLTVQNISYFTWDRSVYGPNCSHNLYEDDGGGTTTVSFTITNPDTGINTTVSDTRPVNNADMGTVTFLYTEDLTTTHRTSDFELDMK